MNIYSEPTEKRIIGCLMDYPETVNFCISHIIPEAFYIIELRKVYLKIIELNGRGLDCDYLTVAESFKADNDKIDNDMLFNLAAQSETSVHVESWCNILMNLYCRRILQIEGVTISEIAKSTENAEKDIRNAIKRCNDAMELARHKVSVNTGDVLNESIKFIQQINENPNQFIVPYYLKGMGNEIKHARKQIHILAAPPNTGKTGFALSLLESQIQHGIKHVIFCHETPRVYLMNRLLSMRANLTTEQLFEIASSGEMSRLIQTAESIKEQVGLFRIYGSGDYTHSVAGICSAIEMMVEGGFKPDIITIDYIQNLRPSSGTQKSSRSEQIESMVLDLSRIFKEMDIAGLWLSQINRDKTRDQKGTDFINADLKGSSAIEQEADFITFIKRTRPGDNKGITNMQWKSTKIRGGHMIDCELGFNIGNGKVLGVIDRFEGSI